MMSDVQRKNFDTFFKGFIVVALTIIGFFAKRTVDGIDESSKRIEKLEISTSIMQIQILTMNDNWKQMFKLENERQREYADERYKEALKK